MAAIPKEENRPKDSNYIVFYVFVGYCIIVIIPFLIAITLQLIGSCFLQFAKEAWSLFIKDLQYFHNGLNVLFSTMLEQFEVLSASELEQDDKDDESINENTPLLNSSIQIETQTGGNDFSSGRLGYGINNSAFWFV
ncbi:uncharacterized protein RJT20DRAFT_135753 [Scheffersomyces xylosifermentans]|uniref:uncharacterized protein n=1 Tax=Scheffersomyces xylosifermentans TaxID=1304137 RepID=UPI00315DF960